MTLWFFTGFASAADPCCYPFGFALEIGVVVSILILLTRYHVLCTVWYHGAPWVPHGVTMGYHGVPSGTMMSLGIPWVAIRHHEVP